MSATKSIHTSRPRRSARLGPPAAAPSTRATRSSRTSPPRAASSRAGRAACGRGHGREVPQVAPERGHPEPADGERGVRAAIKGPCFAVSSRGASGTALSGPSASLGAVARSSGGGFGIVRRIHPGPTGNRGRRARGQGRPLGACDGRVPCQLRASAGQSMEVGRVGVGSSVSEGAHPGAARLAAHHQPVQQRAGADRDRGRRPGPDPASRAPGVGQLLLRDRRLDARGHQRARAVRDVAADPARGRRAPGLRDRLAHAKPERRRRRPGQGGARGLGVAAGGDHPPQLLPAHVSAHHGAGHDRGVDRARGPVPRAPFRYMLAVLVRRQARP